MEAKVVFIGKKQKQNKNFERKRSKWLTKKAHSQLRQFSSLPWFIQFVKPTDI